jgi:hypothetical protein
MKQLRTRFYSYLGRSITQEPSANQIREENNGNQIRSEALCRMKKLNENPTPYKIDLMGSIPSYAKAFNY